MFIQSMENTPGVINTYKCPAKNIASPVSTYSVNVLLPEVGNYEGLHMIHLPIIGKDCLAVTGH